LIILAQIANNTPPPRMAMFMVMPTIVQTISGLIFVHDDIWRLRRGYAVRKRCWSPFRRMGETFRASIREKAAHRRKATGAGELQTSPNIGDHSPRKA
jgi:hypothetical protein